MLWLVFLLELELLLGMEIKIRVKITVSKWSVVMYLLLMANLRFWNTFPVGRSLLWRGI